MIDSNPIVPHFKKTKQLFLYWAFIKIWFIVTIFCNLYLTIWIYQGQDQDQWKGNLYRINQQNADLNSQSYQQLSNSFCDYQKTNENNWTGQLYQLLCDRFQQLHILGQIHIICSYIYIFSLAIELVILPFALKRLKLILYLHQPIQIVASIIYLFGSLNYLIQSPFTFGDCKYMYRLEINSDLTWEIQLLDVCLSWGGILLIITLICYFLFKFYDFFVVYWLLFKTKKEPQWTKDEIPQSETDRLEKKPNKDLESKEEPGYEKKKTADVLPIEDFPQKQIKQV